MQELKRLFYLLFSAFILITGWGGWWLLQHIFTGSYFTWYPFIPSFFYLYGMIFINVLINSKKDNPRKLTNLYMILKLCKILASLLIAGIYLIAVKVQLREFSMVFITYYLLYMGLETYFFYRVEQVIKKNNTDGKLS
jgi:glucan phosphoethanolaminetransferase (alkaline phosphatase superfamily)